MKVVLLETKLGALEAVKNLEIGAKDNQLRMKVKHVEDIGFQ